MQKQVKQIRKIPELPNCIQPDGHINVNPIIELAKKLDCPFIVFIGSKRIGKTYGCVGYGLREFYKYKRPAFYGRRYDTTFTENICGNLVRVHRQDIINYSKGTHNDGELRGKYFDLVHREYTDKGLIRYKNRQHFLYCRSLNKIEAETADDKGEISCGIYDEFLTRGRELNDEFNKIMVYHANATGKRTDYFIPFFLLGNTVEKESNTAKNFGIDLRKIKREVNIINNSKGEIRCIVYYAPETEKDEKSADKYYDRFENTHINMISHGDWTLGTYQIATAAELSLTGYSALVSHDNFAVKLTIATYGMQPRVIITAPDSIYSTRITSGLSKHAINFLPRQIVELICNGYMVVENAEIGENFRDICKHITNGERIVKKYE